MLFSSQTEMLKFLLEAGADLYIINDVRLISAIQFQQSFINFSHYIYVYLSSIGREHSICCGSQG